MPSPRAAMPLPPATAAGAAPNKFDGTAPQIIGDLGASPPPTRLLSRTGPVTETLAMPLPRVPTSLLLATAAGAADAVPNRADEAAPQIMGDLGGSPPPTRLLSATSLGTKPLGMPPPRPPISLPVATAAVAAADTAATANGVDETAPQIIGDLGATRLLSPTGPAKEILGMPPPRAPTPSLLATAAGAGAAVRNNVDEAALQITGDLSASPPPTRSLSPTGSWGDTLAMPSPRAPTSLPPATADAGAAVAGTAPQTDGDLGPLPPPARLL